LQSAIEFCGRDEDFIRTLVQFLHLKLFSLSLQLWSGFIWFDNDWNSKGESAATQIKVIHHLDSFWCIENRRIRHCLGRMLILCGMWR
jgi:hypothetical protein